MNLQALKNNKKDIYIKEEPIKDIIITKYETKEEYDEEGNRIIKRIERKVNLTRKINETAKLLKIDTLKDKYEKVKEIFERGV